MHAICMRLLAWKCEALAGKERTVIRNALRFARINGGLIIFGNAAARRDAICPHRNGGLSAGIASHHLEIGRLSWRAFKSSNL